MTRENREFNIEEFLTEFHNLREENESLRLDNDFLEKQNRACKLRCGKYALRIQELENEIADLRFTHKYLTSEEAGRQFAKELLGGA